MSIYTTPLQFGYFFALLIALLLLVRGIREERLSDKLLAAVMFLLGMEIQDYTFGFAGINFLWDQMEGFPRHFNLAFAPTIYLYLKSQINKDFKLKKADLWHYLPYGIYFLVSIFIFLQGKETIHRWYDTPFLQFLSWVETVAIWASYIYFFYQSLKLYNHFRSWTETQFSDTEIISFDWLRNFIYLIITAEIFKYCWQLADFIIEMPYEKDWWWHLYTVSIICYVGLRGYTQVQPKKLSYIAVNESDKELSSVQNTPIELPETDYSNWKNKIEKLFEQEKVYLEPELSLTELAQKLKTNTSILSAAINKNYNINFNDFINQYRIKEFEIQIKNPENKNYTKLAVALDCGFNSKATFNRALKKFGIGNV
jgi:AraC-like DNA-binding protein